MQGVARRGSGVLEGGIGGERRDGSGGKGVNGKRKNGRTWVLKVISLPESKEEKEKCLKEAATMMKLRHPCIVSCKESFVDPDEGIFCIAMEKCCGGELRHLINRQKAADELVEEDQVLHWLLQLLLALEYLNHKKVLHRDLKSENVFLRSPHDFPHGNSATVQLGDFGISRVLNHADSMTNSFVGTPLYMSPELIRNEPYSFKSDIWALGCILYEMMCLRKPFEAATVQDLVHLVLNTDHPEPPPKYSYDLCYILSKMLQKDADDRPSAATILSFPLLRDRTAQFLASCRDFAEEAQAVSEDVQSPTFKRRYSIHREVVLQARRLGLKLPSVGSYGSLPLLAPPLRSLSSSEVPSGPKRHATRAQRRPQAPREVLDSHHGDEGRGDASQVSPLRDDGSSLRPCEGGSTFRPCDSCSCLQPGGGSCLQSCDGTVSLRSGCHVAAGEEGIGGGEAAATLGDDCSCMRLDGSRGPVEEQHVLEPEQGLELEQGLDLGAPGQEGGKMEGVLSGGESSIPQQSGAECIEILRRYRSDDVALGRGRGEGCWTTLPTDSIDVYHRRNLAGPKRRAIHQPGEAPHAQEEEEEAQNVGVVRDFPYMFQEPVKGQGQEQGFQGPTPSGGNQASLQSWMLQSKTQAELLDLSGSSDDGRVFQPGPGNKLASFDEPCAPPRRFHRPSLSLAAVDMLPRPPPREKVKQPKSPLQRHRELSNIRGDMEAAWSPPTEPPEVLELPTPAMAVDAGQGHAWRPQPLLRLESGDLVVLRADGQVVQGLRRQQEQEEEGSDSTDSMGHGFSGMDYKLADKLQQGLSAQLNAIARAGSSNSSGYFVLRVVEPLAEEIPHQQSGQDPDEADDARLARLHSWGVEGAQGSCHGSKLNRRHSVGSWLVELVPATAAAAGAEGQMQQQQPPNLVAVEMESGQGGTLPPARFRKLQSVLEDVGGDGVAHPLTACPETQESHDPRASLPRLHSASHVGSLLPPPTTTSAGRESSTMSLLLNPSQPPALGNQDVLHRGRSLGAAVPAGPGPVHSLTCQQHFGQCQTPDAAWGQVAQASAVAASAAAGAAGAAGAAARKKVVLQDVTRVNAMTGQGSAGWSHAVRSSSSLLEMWSPGLEQHIGAGGENLHRGLSVGTAFLGYASVQQSSLSAQSSTADCLAAQGPQGSGTQPQGFSSCGVLVGGAGALELVEQGLQDKVVLRKGSSSGVFFPAKSGVQVLQGFPGSQEPAGPATPAGSCPVSERVPAQRGIHRGFSAGDALLVQAGGRRRSSADPVPGSKGLCRGSSSGMVQQEEALLPLGSEARLMEQGSWSAEAVSNGGVQTGLSVADGVSWANASRPSPGFPQVPGDTAHHRGFSGGDARLAPCVPSTPDQAEAGAGCRQPGSSERLYRGSSMGDWRKAQYSAVSSPGVQAPRDQSPVVQHRSSLGMLHRGHSAGDAGPGAPLRGLAEGPQATNGPGGQPVPGDKNRLQKGKSTGSAPSDVGPLQVQWQGQGMEKAVPSGSVGDGVQARGRSVHKGSAAKPPTPSRQRPRLSKADVGSQSAGKHPQQQQQQQHHSPWCGDGHKVCLERLHEAPGAGPGSFSATKPPAVQNSALYSRSKSAHEASAVISSLGGDTYPATGPVLSPEPSWFSGISNNDEAQGTARKDEGTVLAATDFCGPTPTVIGQSIPGGGMHAGSGKPVAVARTGGIEEDSISRSVVVQRKRSESEIEAAEENCGTPQVASMNARQPDPKLAKESRSPRVTFSLLAPEGGAEQVASSTNSTQSTSDLDLPPATAPCGEHSRCASEVLFIDLSAPEAEPAVLLDGSQGKVQQWMQGKGGSPRARSKSQGRQGRTRYRSLCITADSEDEARAVGLHQPASGARVLRSRAADTSLRGQQRSRTPEPGIGRPARSSESPAQVAKSVNVVGEVVSRAVPASHRRSRSLSPIRFCVSLLMSPCSGTGHSASGSESECSRWQADGQPRRGTGSELKQTANRGKVAKDGAQHSAKKSSESTPLRQRLPQLAMRCLGADSDRDSGSEGQALVLELTASDAGVAAVAQGFPALTGGTRELVLDQDDGMRKNKREVSRQRSAKDTEDSDSAWLHEVITGMQKLPSTTKPGLALPQDPGPAAEPGSRPEELAVQYDEESWKRLAVSAASSAREGVASGLRKPPALQGLEDSTAATGPGTPSSQEPDLASPRMSRILAKAPIRRVFGPSQRKNPKRHVRRRRRINVDCYGFGHEAPVDSGV